MKENSPEKGVQRSRHSAALSPTAREAFARAKECYRAVRDHQRSALLKAKETGNWFDKARAAIRQDGGSFRSILRSEMKGFGKHSVANVYNYIKIDDGWDLLERERKKNPDLSIDAALRFLRTGSTGRPSKGIKYETLITEIVEDALEDWTHEEKEWLSDHYEQVILHVDSSAILKRSFEKVRSKVRAAMERDGV